jgi:hypothetical protein
MSVTTIAEATFTSPDRVREVIHTFNADGFDALYPKYQGRPAEEVHHLAEQARHRRTPTQDRQQGERCLRRRSRGKAY